MLTINEREYIDERVSRINELCDMARQLGITVPAPELTDNRFCATGAGGGVDPSCGGKDDHGPKADAVAHKVHEVEHANHLVHSVSHGHLGLHEIAIVAGMGALKPAVVATKAAITRVKGGTKVANAVSKMYHRATEIAEKVVAKAIERYGEGTVGAALASGRFVSALAGKAAGFALEPAVNRVTRYLGAIPALALAEVGHQFGIVNKGSKIDKGLAKAATGIHLLQHALGKPARAVASVAKAVIEPASRAASFAFTGNESVDEFLIAEFTSLLEEYAAELAEGDELFAAIEDEL